MTDSKSKPLPSGGLLDRKGSIFTPPPARPTTGLLERVDRILSQRHPTPSTNEGPRPMINQPKGNFVAFLNRDKRAYDNQPMFIGGHIAKPGVKDELPLTLWAF
jgi:hypothetical protein